MLSEASSHLFGVSTLSPIFGLNLFKSIFLELNNLSVFPHYINVYLVVSPHNFFNSWPFNTPYMSCFSSFMYMPRLSLMTFFVFSLLLELPVNFLSSSHMPFQLKWHLKTTFSLSSLCPPLFFVCWSLHVVLLVVPTCQNLSQCGTNLFQFLTNSSSLLLNPLHQTHIFCPQSANFQLI